jgi:cell division GTPase FtsZ
MSEENDYINEGNPNNVNKEEEQIKALYGEEPSVDLSMPEGLLIPPDSQEENVVKKSYSKEIKDKVDVAFKFCFIGSGQAGGRIAHSFKKLGYERIAAINTAEQDLNTLDLENKYCFGEGGVGKNKQVAAALFDKSKEDILDFLRYSFGESFDRIFICTAAGGGTGAGALYGLVQTAKELQETINGSPHGVGVILALPKKSEGKKVNANAAETLETAYSLVQNKTISTLILIDNEKISTLYPSLSISGFWDAANSSLTGLFHLYNLTASKDSTYSSFDANDYRQILNSGLIALGASPVSDWEDPICISRVVRENVKNNLLCDGMNLSSGSCAGIIAIGGKEVLENVPQAHLDAAFSQLSRILRPHSTIHIGIYSGDKPDLNIFTMVGGLEKPIKKIKLLRQQADLG